MRRVLVLTALLTMLLVSGCDLLGDDPCHAGPSANEADFIPIAEGNRWVYRYQYRHYGPAIADFTIIDSATVELSVQSVECHDGVRRAVILEEVEGIRRQYPYDVNRPPLKETPVSGSRTNTLTELVNGHVIHPLLSDSLRRYHAAAHDTLTIEDHRGGNMAKFNGGDTCGDGGAYKTDVTLVKGRGVEKIWFVCSPRHHQQRFGGYTLLEADLRTVPSH